MNKDIVRQWANLIAFLFTVTVNGLANALPLNNQTTGEISDSFQVFFVPAGYVFSIWGLIYLALAGFVIYQLLPAQGQNPGLQRIGYWFVISCLANGIWIFLWHYEYFALTLVAMLVLLISLIQIYLRLDIGRRKASSSERFFIHLPFSIYLGWVTVATIANVTSLLDYLNWNGWGIAPEVWAVIMLVVAALVSLAMAWLRADIAYLLVIIWAVVGIAVKQADSMLVANTAWAVVVLVAIGVVLAFLRKKQVLLA
ncbi:MAG TPA: hypothetical protein VLM80_01890 [Anaerolineales bacterium]|nr:hypothetical protein [Anaerolineales bacterium]